MDPVNNPYAPGAGAPPPELAGRDELRKIVRIALERVRKGRPTKSVLLVGLRGVGKTVLLDRMREDAEAGNIHTIRVEAPEERSLPAILAPQLRLALLRLSRNEQAKEFAQRALSGLAGFAKALKVKFQDIEVGFDFEPEPGLADNGDLEHDLQALLEVVGMAAKQGNTALVMFIDELQYVKEEELAALITALHRTAQHRSGDIADQLGREVTSLAPTRSQLISKGMIWSPSHGDTAFTVPLFNEYMKRIMPGDDWKG